ELIEVTSELNWQNDPQLLSRVDELCETLTQMKLEREQNIASGKTHAEADHQDWFVDISVPVRQAAAETIRESDM
ncbi:hypothetical protein, partial [uncultured Gimesia sp.]|nr:hypothetical protein [Planctomycetaceae bacterium]